MGEQMGLFQHGPAERMYDRGAVLSPCQRYRYRLWRMWDDDLLPTVFVMLNPSTADALVDDPTIRRCMGFARSWGAGGIIVVNLYAYRATDPRQLAQAHAEGVDVRGPARDNHLRSAFAAADNIIVAWGAHPLAPPAVASVLSLVPDGVEVSCLGKTRDGAPRHPLYLASATPRERFQVSHG